VKEPKLAVWLEENLPEGLAGFSFRRLVTAVVMETSEDWQTGKRYLSRSAQESAAERPERERFAA
jgi:hypothetical protein